jgi:crotonobetainyl-CoA:carnitine CoA-transferase CaiB-like acyl-CoA transferase
MLGDWGTNVIKVEVQGSGDESQSWGALFVDEPYDTYSGELAYSTISTNRNNFSVMVNPKRIKRQDLSGGHLPPPLLGKHIKMCCKRD